MHCLICYERKHEKISKDTKITDFFKDCNSLKEAVISPELSVIFVVRNILDIPSSFCEQLISSEGNPSSWEVHLCTVCERVVKEAQFIHQRIKNLVDEYDELKGKLKGVAQNSLKDKKSSSNRKRNVTDTLRLGLCKTKKVPFTLQAPKTSRKSIQIQKEHAVVFENKLENFDDDNDDPLYHFDDADDNDDHLNMEENDANDEIAANPVEDKVEDEVVADIKENSDGLKYFQFANGKFACPIEPCKYTFKTKIIAQGHVQRYHYGDNNPYRCKKCGRGFQSPNKLNKHPCRGKSAYARYRKRVNLQIKNVRSVIIKTEAEETENQSEDFLENVIFPFEAGSNNEQSMDMDVDDNGLQDTSRRSLRERKPIKRLAADTESDDNNDDPKSPDWKANSENDSDNDEFKLRGKKIHRPSKSLIRPPRIKPVLKQIRRRGIDKKPKNKFPFTCNHCPKSFEKQYILDAHIRRFHQNLERPFECDLCTRRFVTIRDVLIHIDRVHPENSKEPEQEPEVSLNLTSAEEANLDGNGNEDSNNGSVDQLTNLPSEPPKREYKRVSTVVSTKKKPMHYKFSKKHPHACHECGYSFTKMYDMDYHLLRVHYGEPSPFRCDICKNRQFNRFRGIDRHRRNYHPDIDSPYEGYYDAPKNPESVNDLSLPCRCPICTERFPVIGSLDEHMETEHGIKKPTEDQVPPPKPRMPKPKQVILGIKLQSSKCPEPECGKEFSSSLKCEAHIRRVHSRPNSTNICQECGLRFLTEKGLEEHITTGHKGAVPQEPSQRKIRIVKEERKFICEFCCDSYTTELYLQNHQNLMHYKEIGKDPIKCTYCDKVLGTQRSLKYHIQIVHENNGKIKCDRCPRTFLFEAYLQDHIRIFHTGEKPFKCSHEGCSKAFSKKMYLSNHERLHTGEKPYKCKDCGKLFSDQPTYRRHTETHGDKIHKCPNCGREFKVWHSYRNHMKIHGKPPGSSSRKRTRAPKNSKRKIELSSESEDSDDSYSDKSEGETNLPSSSSKLVPIHHESPIKAEPTPPILQIPGPIPEINQWQSQEIEFPKLINNSLHFL